MKNQIQIPNIDTLTQDLIQTIKNILIEPYEIDTIYHDDTTFTLNYQLNSNPLSLSDFEEELHTLIDESLHLYGRIYLYHCPEDQTISFNLEDDKEELDTYSKTFGRNINEHLTIFDD